jgi:hypothetical protein
LKNALPKTVKRESETRWSARADAVDAINSGLSEMLNLLETLVDDENTTHETKSEADILLKNILNFNFIVLLHFWNELLGKIN